MSAFASRYASAFTDVVLEQKLDPAQVASDLGDFAAAWHESRDLREIFLDPSFPSAQKVAVLDKLNTRLAMSGTVRNFLAVLISHDRMDGFDEVLTDYRREIDRRLGISEVTVTTARPLGQDERKALEAQIAQLADSGINAKFLEDPSLLGGVVLRIGSTVYDGSVRGRLDQLKRQLTGE
ncbi:ATP synthase F1 subunit delta [Acidipila rosea]|uniref:ATP synthase subunit delta n=1 Tax=Acidipila rosea TaxID=768535 RepID=A0A4R1L6A0_9BACT|nr:ATP synthase F1 subunit delta [Acidipila rosea]MBW4026816.1 ATP synthase F1 subunit delta [Acidobacteriota bacterium]MBW4043395.1 ATP synthase F1 subunit delta [Acidobacteriota bacterium]TCK73698.1 ATP synthase F1 subcomplex delta subunit [Acidipila rosea]